VDWAVREFVRLGVNMIELKNVTKTYKTGEVEFRALKGVSFSIEDGEFVAIMGPSGSGKSTLMHILGALDTPTSGTYFLDGKDVSTLSEDELADIRKNKIGFVFQSFNLLPRTTVLRNVMLPLVYAGVAREKRETQAKEALKNASLVWDFIIETIFARHAPLRAANKAKISREVTPWLGAITDNILQAHYAKLVAERLDIPPEAVFEEINSHKKGSSPPETFFGHTASKKGRKQLIEERLIAIALKISPSALLRWRRGRPFPPWKTSMWPG